jgi:hypothetical protein
MWYFDPMLKGMVARLSASGFAAQAAIQPGWASYHFNGQRYCGCTKTGKFLCQHDAIREGCRPTRNGQ